MRFHEQAFKYFCQRKTQKEIAKKVNAKVRTVEAWSAKEDWKRKRKEKEKESVERAEKREEKSAEKREEVLGQFQNTMFVKLANDTEEMITALMYCCKIAAQVTAYEGAKIARAVAIEKGGGKKGYTAKDLDRFIRHLRETAQAFKLTLPNVCDELGVKMLEEFWEIERRLKEEENIIDIDVNGVRAHQIF